MSRSHQEMQLELTLWALGIAPMCRSPRSWSIWPFARSVAGSSKRRMRPPVIWRRGSSRASRLRGSKRRFWSRSKWATSCPLKGAAGPRHPETLLHWPSRTPRTPCIPRIPMKFSRARLPATDVGPYAFAPIMGPGRRRGGFRLLIGAWKYLAQPFHRAPRGAPCLLAERATRPIFAG